MYIFALLNKRGQLQLKLLYQRGLLVRSFHGYLRIMWLNRVLVGGPRPSGLATCALRSPNCPRHVDGGTDSFRRLDHARRLPPELTVLSNCSVGGACKALLLTASIERGMAVPKATALGVVLLKLLERECSMRFLECRNWR